MNYIKYSLIILTTIFVSSCSTKSNNDTIFRKALNVQIKTVAKSHPSVKSAFNKHLGLIESKRLAKEYCRSFQNSTYKKRIKSNWVNVNSWKKTKNITSDEVRDIFYGHKGIAEAGIFAYCPKYIDRNMDRETIFLSYIYNSRHTSGYSDKRRTKIRTNRRKRIRGFRRRNRRNQRNQSDN